MPHDRPPSRLATLSLEHKLPLVISGLVALVVLVSCWAAYREVRTADVLVATGRLERVTRQLADLSAGATSQRNAQIRRVLDDSAVRAALRDPARAADALPILQRTIFPADSTLTTTELWTAAGERRAVLGAPAPVADSARVRALVRAAARSDSVRGSPLEVVGDSVVVWNVVPVRADNALLGFVAQRRRVGNSPQVERQIQQLIGQNVSVFFTDTSGRVWTTLAGKPVAPLAAIGRLGSSFEEWTTRGQREIGAAARVSRTPLVIVLALPRSAVLSRADAFLKRMLLVGALLVVAGALGARLLTRRVTTPLRQLTDAADAVATGDLEQRVQTARGDELGRLAASFNAMAQHIGASHAELRRSRDETLRASARLGRLQEVTAALASAVDVDAVARVVVEQGVAAVGAAAGVIFVRSADGAELTLVRADGYTREALDGWTTLPVEMPVPLAEAVRTASPVLVADRAEWRARYGAAWSDPRGDTQAWAALPLVARDRILGAVGMSFAREAPFDPETRAFLLTVAQQCAQALDRALLFDAALQARREAEDAREAAESANQAKAAFLATMSHELRTPLNAIGGYVELMDMGLRGDLSAEQRHDLARIRRSQQHLLGLINDVLHFAKLDAGHVTFTVAPVELDRLIRDLEPLIAPQVRAKGLAYVYRGCDPQLRALADAEKLQQILLNLLSNAVKFTGPGGRVEVECGVRGEGSVWVSVRDTGVGIPRDRLRTVFEPFVQAEQKLTRVHEGIGLGLAISRDLARGMGGELSAESEVGVGSVFTVVVPGVGMGVALGPARGAEAEARG
jgi:signal transduction histidine kinase